MTAELVWLMARRRWNWNLRHYLGTAQALRPVAHRGVAVANRGVGAAARQVAAHYEAVVLARVAAAMLCWQVPSAFLRV